jgi:hypothetical protein
MLNLDATSSLVSLSSKQTNKYFDVDYQDILNYFVLLTPIDNKSKNAVMIAELCSSANDTSEILNFLNKLQFSYKAIYENDPFYFRYFKYLFIRVFKKYNLT